jgi:hypothetical protein
MVAPAVLSELGLDAVLAPDAETLVARLTRAAYDVPLRHSPDRPFTELELALWHELRLVFVNAPESVRKSA